MMFIVATNVVTSRPPERWPTGTPHACANLRAKFLSGKNFREPISHMVEKIVIWYGLWLS